MASSGPDTSPIEWLRSKPVVLLIAFPEWRGVFSAALAQGPVLGIRDMNRATRRAALVDLLALTPSLRAVVVHGIPPGSIELAKDLHARLPHLRIYFVYHGTASAPFHHTEADLVDRLIEANQEGYVHALGSVKVGFSEMFRGFGARSVFTVPNFPYVMPLLPTQKYSSRDGKVHIGILVSSDGFHKNIATQLVAACSVPHAVIHVTVLPDLSYLKRCGASIVVTGMLPHAQFLTELGRMDIVMYVSLTECYPMLVVEAMGLGIPAVVSRTHHIYDTDPVLLESLVVDEADNPSAILSRLLMAVARLDELRMRLLVLLPCLRRAAEREWGAILALSESESRRLQLTEYADELATAGSTNHNRAQPKCKLSAQLSTPLLFPPKASALAAPVRAEPDLSPFAARIAFITYELFPGNPGGAGVVISYTILELLRAGVGVTVLAHTSPEALSQWSRHMAERGFPPGDSASSALIVHHVPTLTQEAHLIEQECHPGNIFLARARVFALAARRAYEAVAFDALEVFEYVGAAFELLRSLRDLQEGVARGSAPETPLYLPASVPVLVRLHGSIQLISQVEVGPLVYLEQDSRRRCSLDAPEAAAAPLMHLMERYVLQTAHVLLPQSAAMKATYELAYGLTSERMLLAPPPVDSILADLKQLVKTGPHVDSSSAPLGGEGSDFRLLVYGRVARMKGAETVALAVPALQALLPATAKVRLLFAGIDWPHPTENIPFSKVVQRLLPDGLASAVEFLGPIERGVALQELCRTVHGAIIASEFETYGLAAHELAVLGVPLVISDIPAFSEFFTPSNSYTFQAGNSTDLSLAAMRLYGDLLEGRRSAIRLARLKYADPLEPYERVLRRLRSTGIPPSSLDVRLTEEGIKRLETKCWSSPGCFEQWARPVAELSPP